MLDQRCYDDIILFKNIILELRVNNIKHGGTAFIYINQTSLIKEAINDKPTQKMYLCYIKKAVKRKANVIAFY
jgi:hypothetical protein